jgi:hypothetical protein
MHHHSPNDAIKISINGSVCLTLVCIYATAPVVNTRTQMKDDISRSTLTFASNDPYLGAPGLCHGSVKGVTAIGF